MAATAAITEQLIAQASVTYAVANGKNKMATPASQTGTPGLATNDIAVRVYRLLNFDWNVTAISGGSATVTAVISRKGADGTYYPIYTSSAIAAPGKQGPITLGDGASTNVDFGDIIQVEFDVSNTTTPSVTLTASLIAKS